MVHPTPAETIRGVRQILRDVIEPHVSSDYARIRLREVRAVLATVDWDDPAAGVRSEIAALHQVLADARAWASGREVRAAALAEVMDSELPEQPAPDSRFADVCAYRNDVAQRVICVTDRLREWGRAYPGDGAEAVLARALEAMAG